MSKIILLFVLISLISTKGPYKMDKDVYILTQKNFGFALHEFKYLLVLFYDPECPHCKDFMPIYEKTATLLKNENFIFTKIDCEKNQKIEETYNIETFPTLMLLIGEKRIIYEGKRNSEDIKKWLEEKTKPKITEIDTKDELDKFTKNKISLVYFGNNETTINNIIIAERKFETMPIGIVSNEELIKEESLNEKNNKEYINIYKDFDNHIEALSNNLSHENIYKFVNTYYYPRIIDFNDYTAPIIFSKRQPSLVLFSSIKNSENNNYSDILNKIWPEIKYKIKLFLCVKRGYMASRMAEYCGITENNIPKIFIVEAENETPKKYEMNGEINKENIMNFINNWSEGKLEPYIRSEPIPEKNDNALVKLVGKNFKKEVIENDKDVLVYFVSPKCTRCQEFEPQLEKLAKKLKKNNKLLVIAKMDAILNDIDIDELQIHSFPTIVFYPGNTKDKEPLQMKGRKNDVEAIEKFITSNAYTMIKTEENSDL